MNLSMEDRSIIELVGMPGFGLILKFNREEIESAEQALLENKKLSEREFAYYQGYRKGAISLRNFVEDLLERAELTEKMED